MEGNNFPLLAAGHRWALPANAGGILPCRRARASAVNPQPLPVPPRGLLCRFYL